MNKETAYVWNQVFLYLLLVVILIGISANSLLIFMFIRHRKLRTGSNELIFNLAVADFFHISVNGISTFLVFQNVVVLSEIMCKIEESFRLVSVGVSLWSVAALSVHRYITIMSTSVTNLKMKRNAKVFIVVVWLLVMILALPVSLTMTSGYGNRCKTTLDIKFVTLFSLLVYSVVPLVIIVIMYILTARKLEQSAQSMPGEGAGQEKQRNARIRGAKILVALTLVFVISYLPLLAMIFVNSWFEPLVPLPFLLLGALCHFVSSVANPVALFLSSKVYKAYFTIYFKYLCCCQKNALAYFVNTWKTSSSKPTSSSRRKTVQKNSAL